MIVWKQQRPHRNRRGLCCFAEVDQLFSALLDRQIMDIQMTGQALREHLEQFLGMRFRRGVAVGAFRNQPVLGVAKCAADSAMLAGGAAPLGVDIAVASIARFDIDSLFKADIERLVNVVTLGAGCHRLCGKVWFVTLSAGRDVAVPIVVAAAALLLGVFARLSLQLFSLVAVAVRTDPGQHVGHWNPAWRMWVFVAVQALNVLVAVFVVVTGCTLGHDIRVILFQRIVGVKHLVTFTTIKAMQSAGFFEVAKVGRMTLTTLGHL